MASRSTPLKRKVESNSETPNKKRNWLSLEDELDIIKRYENGSNLILNQVFQQGLWNEINLMTKFQNFSMKYLYSFI